MGIVLNYGGKGKWAVVVVIVLLIRVTCPVFTSLVAVVLQMPHH